MIWFLYSYNKKARRSMDRIFGFGPIDGGSNPPEPMGVNFNSRTLTESLISVFVGHR